MDSTEDANSKAVPANEPQLDLYTIPSHSCWFSWGDIHETEKISLKDFFDGSSISKTPKIYKEYRDFIINKYREEPSRGLTFTEVRKSLIGDVSVIHKVFLFLEKWGLINFIAPLPDNLTLSPEDEERRKVKFEEGAPLGIRVVAVPNSLKVVSLPPTVTDNGEVVENGFRLPPLASYSDIFGDLMRQKGLVCGNCGEDCVSGHYESTKGKFVLCVKCFKTGNYGENKSLDDFKFNDCIDHNGNHGADVWTDAETLLLLESVQKHGDDWELVAQNVQSKSKLDCISKLIQLPFGELMLGSTNGKGESWNTKSNSNSVKQVQSTSVEPQEPTKRENTRHSYTNESELVGGGENQSPPSKRRCLTSLEDAGGSLMKQVATLSTMVGPHIAAAAAEAAITALYDENPCAREMFEGKEDNVTNEFGSPTLNNEPERILEVEDFEMRESNTKSEMQKAPPEENAIPLTLQIRAAIATALGSTAAHAKLLADQEDREIEHLMANIIETQLRKIHCKVKHFEELELIMEKEYTQIEEMKESLIVERIDILQRAFNAGVSRWRDHSSVKSLTGTVF
ncbi:hypothetical protein HHK36_025208 [Tetracentron sinense]|uniref:SWI/SNF complex subunit SWI3A n=1 Tax=Tetracentron sinense TaxID=13715 RepID=A0A834YS90_TETSI|nr:hypothetical protein HHK36_025208 [Tetracentron sinense]